MKTENEGKFPRFFIFVSRGLSSTVRRVVEKRTGREFAAKIIDLSTENNSDAQAADLRTAAKREVALLLKLQGHPNISMVK